MIHAEMRFATIGRSLLLYASLLLCRQVLLAEDWAQFRGPSSGVSRAAEVPITWSETENLKWKTELPGAGSSSPIVVGDAVFLTCYSGYGVPKQAGGDLKKLERHIVCVNRSDGTIRWKHSIPGDSPEDPYQGYISEHGYASSTPVSDGKYVYCFFGKSGVYAFDLAGKQQWHVNVGRESSSRRWGSAASLILYKDLLIVNASEESQSIRALDKQTGQEKWKASASSLELAYGTPSVLKLKDRDELVIAVPGELWGLNLETGKLLWFAEHSLTGNVSPSVVCHDDQIFAFGGFRSSGSLAVRAGGSGDVSKSRLLWSSRLSSYVATPVLYDGNLYWIDDRGQAYCCDAKTGAEIYRERVPGLDAGGRPVYASPIVVHDKIYVPTRWNGVLVLAAKPKLEIIARNRFTGDESDFNATPAVSDQQLFLRSNRFLYCVSRDSK